MTRQRIWRVLEGTGPSGVWARATSGSIVVLILLNMAAVAMGTMPHLPALYHRLLWDFETLSVIVFSAEYLFRVWSCTADPAFRPPLAGRIRYMLTPLALVDLASIVPFYLPMLIPMDLRILRVFRLLRILRVLKLGRHSDALRTLWRVVAHKRHELTVTALVLAVLLFFSSSVMYFAEHDAQPAVFTSIPGSMWWALVALTSSGYDIPGPVTALGRLFGGIVALLGVGIFALPAGILASGFAEEIQRRHGRRRMCPHCGRDIEEPQPAEASSVGTSVE